MFPCRDFSMHTFWPMRPLVLLLMNHFPSFTLGLALLLCGCGSQAPRSGIEFVVAADTNQVAQVTSNEWQRVASVLTKRMRNIGCPTSVEILPGNRISVKIEPESKQQIEQTRIVLSAAGLAEFRLVHEASDKLMQDGIVPAGYELLPPLASERGNRAEIVSKKPPAGLARVTFSRLHVQRDPFNRAEIWFELDRDGALAFERLTTDNLGRKLAVIVDRRIYSAPLITAPIPGGHGSITGGFSDDQALALIMVLQDPLEAPLTILEERRF